MKVGIDFGTSTSEIAYVDAKGEVVVIPNHLGQTITPSAIYVKEDHTTLVGKEAKELAIIEPENVMLEVKRLFGQDSTITARGKVYTPTQAATIIINYLLDCAKAYTKQAVTSAVITVPAYFTDAQRKAVLEAGRNAGITIDRLINEPTAASLDYGMRHLHACQHILVYDLGGGTLDVTLLELFEGVIDVKASCGNNTLGGKDFDQALVDHIKNLVTQNYQWEEALDSRANMRIKIAAEACKIALSTEDTFILDLPFIAGTANHPISIYETITRKTFERLIKEKVLSTQTQIMTALADASLAPAEVDMILLVGGSTRIPFVSQFIESIFDKAPATMIDPDLAVVRGAAVQSGVLADTLGKGAVILTDICAHSLSTVVVKDFEAIEWEFKCDVLIPRNSTLPAESHKVYYTVADGQKRVTVKVCQGENEAPEDNEALGEFSIDGIPAARKSKEGIKVTFSYDLSGILIVEAQIVSTGKKASITLDTSATATKDSPVDTSIWRKMPMARHFRTVITKAERVIKLYEDTAKLTSLVSELKEAIVLEWEKEICDQIKDNLLKCIEELENE